MEDDCYNSFYTFNNCKIDLGIMLWQRPGLIFQTLLLAICIFVFVLQGCVNFTILLIKEFLAEVHIFLTVNEP